MVLFAIFLFVSYKENSSSLISYFEQGISEDKQKMKIAERKFMQGKMRKEVFEPLSEEMSVKVLEKELELFKIKKSSEVSIKAKLGQLVEKMSSPNKYKKSKLEKLLKESEIIRSQMSFLESRLLKREIKQHVFEYLIKKKEMEMIDKENEILKIIG
jgi:hypothetical protein